MFRVLKPGGRLVLNVAALDRAAGAITRFFRAKYAVTAGGTCGSGCEAAGFLVRRMTYTNLTILPLVAAVRLKQRLTGHEESQEEISIPPAPINGALSGLLALEASALRW